MSLLLREFPAREHLFYSGLALAYALTVFVGFSRTYYLKKLFGTSRLSWLFHLHGVAFTAWTLFFVFQTLLVVVGRTNVHRRIGWIGAIFAAVIVVCGALLTIHAVRIGHSARGSPMPVLLINGMIDLVLFCVFFGLALLLRNRPAIHKRLMVLAMVVPDHTRDWQAARTAGLGWMDHLCVVARGINLRRHIDPAHIPHQCDLRAVD